MKKSKCGRKNWIGVPIFFMLIFVIATSCDNQNNAITSPRDLNTDHTNILIEQGTSLFDDVSSSYASMAGTGVEVITGSLADYALHPNNWSGESTFTERMENIYWADDNIVKSIENFNSDEETTNSRFIGLVISAVDTGVGIYQDHKRNNLIEMNGERLRQIENMMKSQNIMLQKQEAATAETQSMITNIEDNISSQLNQVFQDLKGGQLEIQMDINDLRSEVREGFASVHQSINTVIENLSELQGEVNVLSGNVSWLTNMLLDEGINEPKNRLEAFYTDFSIIAGSFEQAYNYASAIETDLDFIRREFIDAAINIQEYAISQEQYTDSLFEDSYTTLKRYRCQIERAGSVITTYNFDLPNPKKSVAISFGNLEYLYKIIMTRFIINQTLYLGEELATTNSNSAGFYLESITSSEYNIKNSAALAATEMEDMVNEHIGHIDSSFSDLYSDVVSINYQVQVQEGTSSVWYSVEELDGLSDEERNNEMSRLLSESFIGVYVEYIGPYLAELMALETDLRAFIEEENL